MRDGLLADPAGVADHVGPLDHLVAGADGVRPVVPRLDLAAGLDGRRGDLGGDLVDVLLDDAPLGRGEEAVLEAGVDTPRDREDAGDLAGLGGGGAEQLELLLDRDRERVGDDLGAIGVAIRRRRGQLDRPAAERGIGPGDLDGLAAARAMASRVDLVGGRESPGTVGQNAEAEAERAVIGDRREPRPACPWRGRPGRAG